MRLYQYLITTLLIYQSDSIDITHTCTIMNVINEMQSQEKTLFSVSPMITIKGGRVYQRSINV